MKKSLLLLPLLAFALVGCSEEECDCSSICGWTSDQTTVAPTSAPTSADPTSVDPTTDTSVPTSTTTGTTDTSTSPIEEHVTVLCLGPVGLYKGAPGEKYNVYENCILYKEPVGAALPGASDVTSTSGATFTAWVSYENDGVPTVFTVVPNENYKVLYAQFSGGGGSTTGTTTGTEPVPGSGFTLYFQAKGWWNNDGATTYIYCWDADGGNNGEFPGVDMTFVKEMEDPLAGTVKVYSYYVEAKYIGVKFARHVGDNYYNETADLLIADRGTNNAVWCDGDQPGQIGWFTYTPAA